jgi:hypothetical protein
LFHLLDVFGYTPSQFACRKFSFRRPERRSETSKALRSIERCSAPTGETKVSWPYISAAYYLILQPLTEPA